MENQNAQNLAERIADLLQRSEKRNDEFLHSSLEKFNERLKNVEQTLALQNPPFAIRHSQSNHSSQEKFINLEELAGETMSGLKDEKACPFEPAGKPCDHCAMCNSRGF